MQLAKNVIGVGLSTNNLELMLGFWEKEWVCGWITSFQFFVVRSNTDMMPWVRS